MSSPRCSKVGRMDSRERTRSHTDSGSQSAREAGTGPASPRRVGPTTSARASASETSPASISSFRHRCAATVRRSFSNNPRFMKR